MADVMVSKKSEVSLPSTPSSESTQDGVAVSAESVPCLLGLGTAELSRSKSSSVVDKAVEGKDGGENGGVAGCGNPNPDDTGVQKVVMHLCAVGSIVCSLYNRREHECLLLTLPIHAQLGPDHCNITSVIHFGMFL